MSFKYCVYYEFKYCVYYAETPSYILMFFSFSIHCHGHETSDIWCICILCERLFISLYLMPDMAIYCMVLYVHISNTTFSNKCVYSENNCLCLYSQGYVTPSLSMTTFFHLMGPILEYTSTYFSLKIPLMKYGVAVVKVYHTSSYKSTHTPLLGSMFNRTSCF